MSSQSHRRRNFFCTQRASVNAYLTQYVEGFLSTSNALLYLKYDAYCDGFRSMNRSCILDFIRLLDALLESCKERKLVLCANAGRRFLTNAVFLIGAYMILYLAKKKDPRKFQRAFAGSCSPLSQPDRAVPRRHLHPTRLCVGAVDCWWGCCLVSQ